MIVAFLLLLTAYQLRFGLVAGFVMLMTCFFLLSADQDSFRCETAVRVRMRTSGLQPANEFPALIPAEFIMGMIVFPFPQAADHLT